MIFFFKSKKPKQFNYKPIYLEEEKQNEQDEFHFEKHKNLSDQMYKKWDKVPYSEIMAKGRKKVFYSMIALVFILILIIINIERLESWLAQFE